MAAEKEEQSINSPQECGQHVEAPLSTLPVMVSLFSFPLVPWLEPIPHAVDHSHLRHSASFPTSPPEGKPVLAPGGVLLGAGKTKEVDEPHPHPGLPISEPTIPQVTSVAVVPYQGVPYPTGLQ